MKTKTLQTPTHPNTITETTDLPYVKHAFTGKTKHFAALTCQLPSRTRQEFKDEADINVIMSRYQATGLPPGYVNQAEPQYGDITQIDYMSSLNTVRAATEAFQALPARLRDRFSNDPSNFISFVNDEGNRAEAEKLGLVPKKEAAPAAPILKTEVPIPTGVVNPPSAT